MGNNNNSKWYDIGGIGLQGIMNGFTSFISQLFAKDNMAYQAQLNKELAQYNQMLAQQGMQYQHNLNEVSAQNAYNRNMQMYQQTQSTQAKVRELEQAGLSVGMMQGTPSAGGASAAGQASTSAMAGSAGSVGLAVGTAPILDIANAKLAMAQTRKIEEETRGEKLDNDTQEKYGDAIASANLNILKAQGVGEELQNEFQTYANEVAKATTQDEINTIRANSITAMWSAEIQGNNAKISDATIDTTIAMNNVALWQGLENLELTKAQIEKVQRDTRWIDQNYMLELEKIQMIKDENQKERELKEWSTKYEGELTREITKQTIDIKEKELQHKGEELKLEKKRFIKDCVLDSVGTLVDGTAKIMSAMKPVQIQKTTINTGEQKKE